MTKKKFTLFNTIQAKQPHTANSWFAKPPYTHNTHQWALEKQPGKADHLNLGDFDCET